MRRRLLDQLRSASTIVAVLIVSLAFVLGLVAFLGYFKFESSLTTIAERRIALIANEARGSIELAMRLGLKLEDIQALRSVVESAQARDPRVQNIYVFRSDTGRNLFASDPSVIAAAVDPAWLDAQSSAADGDWTIQTGSSAVIGRRLDSNIAPGIGGIVIVYSLEDVLARIAAMRAKLLLAAAGIFAVFSLVALVGAVLITRGFGRTVRGLADAISASEPSSTGATTPIPESLRLSVDRFREAASEAGRQIDRLEASLPASTDSRGARLATTR